MGEGSCARLERSCRWLRVDSSLIGARVALGPNRGRDIVCSSDRRDFGDKEMLRTFLSRNVDGLVTQPRSSHALAVQ